MENVSYTSSLRGRSIRIKITATEICVFVPLWVSRAKAEKFVADNETIILAKQQKLQVRKKSPLQITPNQSLQTLTFRVVVVPLDDGNKVQAIMQNGELTITYSAMLSVESLQPYFWNSINYFLRKEAKRILPARVAELAQLHGFSFSDVKIQASRSRWGSCSGKKSINLSFYLLLAPQYLVDYVILHELCHTIEMNHQARFWALMDKVTDNKSKRYRNELKQIRLPLL